VPLGGQAVSLLHFDMAGYLGKRNNVDVKVVELGTNAVLFSYLGSIGSTGAGDGDWGQHTGFDVALSSYSGLRIQWVDPSVAANTAIDNIHFSIGAPVPEPASLALMVAGCALIGLRLGRRA